MANIEVDLPAMGEGITEATITRFLKQAGEQVEADEPIIEIATDKVDSEIMAPENGTLEKFLFNEGDIVEVGAIVAIINTGELSEDTPVKQETLKTNKLVVEKKKASIIEKNTSNDILYTHKTPKGKFISPLVRSIANTEGVTLDELDAIKGSGVDNRLTKTDILRYITKKTSPEKQETNKSINLDKGFELIEMDRMRKLIAGYMIESKKTSAHVTSFIELDVTNIVQWRNKVKDEFFKTYNEKITFTPIFVEAAVHAIKKFPMINISVDGDHIILKKNINIGMATALPSGNLIVPVIKSAGELNLLGLSKAVNDLANRARSNKLKPDEIQGGTFTITNLGTFGNITGTPIINQPEVAILAVGAIKKKPAVIETPQGDTIGIRYLMILSMSYDHRVVDGALGGMFLKQVADNLESFDLERRI